MAKQNFEFKCKYLHVPIFECWGGPDDSMTIFVNPALSLVSASSTDRISSRTSGSANGSGRLNAVYTPSCAIRFCATSAIGSNTGNGKKWCTP